MRCRRWQSYLVGLVEGTLEKEAQGEVEEHLEKCVRCQRYLQQLQMNYQMLATYTPPKCQTTLDTLPNKIDDKILVAQFKVGDQNAFSKIMKKYNVRIFSYVRYKVKNYEDAKDITQDIFVKVFKALPNWEPKATFQTWLYTIARNRCIDHFRARSRRTTYSLDDDEQIDIPVATGIRSNPEKIAREGEIGMYIRNALSQLSPKQRDVFTLYHYEGLQIKDIAEVLGISEGTVKVHHHRAMKKLKEILEPVRDKL